MIHVIVLHYSIVYYTILLYYIIELLAPGTRVVSAVGTVAPYGQFM